MPQSEGITRLPGAIDAIFSTERDLEWGPVSNYYLLSGKLDSTAVDAGNSPTTELRRGLLLGRVTSTGKLKQYNPTATDGTQYAIGPLFQEVNMLAPETQIAADHACRYIAFGVGIKSAQVLLLDEQARRQLQKRILFDDFQTREIFGGWSRITAKTGNYTVLSTDNNTHFTTTGNAGALTFTLPTTIPAPGWRARFSNTVDQNMIVAAPANKLVAFNNAAATSVALSTAGNKIGSGFEITVDEGSTKYIAIPYGQGTVTVA
jgi:hypothetical protein